MRATGQIMSGLLKSVQDSTPLETQKHYNLLLHTDGFRGGSTSLCVRMCTCTHACLLLWQRDMTDPSYISGRPPGTRWHEYTHIQTHTRAHTHKINSDGWSGRLPHHSLPQTEEGKEGRERRGRTAGDRMKGRKDKERERKKKKRQKQ